MHKNTQPDPRNLLFLNIVGNCPASKRTLQSILCLPTKVKWARHKHSVTASGPTAKLTSLLFPLFLYAGFLQNVETPVTRFIKIPLATYVVCSHPNKHALPARPYSLSLEESLQYGKSISSSPIVLVRICSSEKILGRPKTSKEACTSCPTITPTGVEGTSFFQNQYPHLKRHPTQNASY